MLATRYGLLSALLVCGSALADKALFRHPWDPTQSVLRLEPHHGLIRTTDSITIHTTDQRPIRVFSRRGQTIYEGPPTTLRDLAPNHYFVECPGDRTQFAVLPADYRGSAFLGTEAFAAAGWDGPVADRLAQMQPTWARVMGEGYWPRVQPAPDQWDWQRLDTCVATNQALGRRLTIMAFVRPSWQTNDATFITDYARYVRALAQRYDGRIHSIQIWNEPWFGPKVPRDLRIPGATEREFVEFYTRLARAARAAIRSVSTNILVLGPEWDANQQHHPLPTTRYAVACGLPELFDIWTWHDDNWDCYPDEPSWVGPIPHRLRVIRELIGAKPLFISEAKFPARSALGIRPGVNVREWDSVTDSKMDWPSALARAVKTTVMYRAGGVLAYLPHVLALGAPYPKPNLEIYGWDMGVTADNLRGPHPKTSAFLMACHRLEHAVPTGTAGDQRRLFIYGWRRPDNTVFSVAWCPRRHRVTLASRLPGQTTDVYGQPVVTTEWGEEPVFVEGLSAAELARRLRIRN